MKELFRLADPDHSKSIDLAEFRVFLSDLQSLETQPERFQREMASRLERSGRSMKTRSMGKDEFGLFSAAFHPLGGGGFEDPPRRPASTSLIEGSIISKAVRENMLGQGVMEDGVEAEIGESNGDGVDEVKVRTVSLASRRRPEFTTVHPAPEDDSIEGGGARVLEGKTEEV